VGDERTRFCFAWLRVPQDPAPEAAPKSEVLPEEMRDLLAEKQA